MRRMIAQEEIGINVEASDPSGCCQLDYGPVVPRRTLAAALPTIHPFAPVGIFIGDENTPARFDEIFLFGKKIVGGIQHFPPRRPAARSVSLVNAGESLIISFTFSKAICLRFYV